MGPTFRILDPRFWDFGSRYLSFIKGLYRSMIVFSLEVVFSTVVSLYNQAPQGGSRFGLISARRDISWRGPFVPRGDYSLTDSVLFTSPWWLCVLRGRLFHGAHPLSFAFRRFLILVSARRTPNVNIHWKQVFHYHSLGCGM